MNYLSVENISKSFGIRSLFSDVSFGINQFQKVAFVAKNGTGKSTLLRILAGLDEPDSGQVIYRKGLKVGFLQQEPNLDPNATIEDVIFAMNSPEMNAIKRYERAVNHPDHADDFQEAYEQMDALGAWEYELKIKQVLSKLNLNDTSWKCGELSGGQEKRVALARVLIESPDFLIMDEPTNHLDLEMVEWLEEFMEKEKITLFMVTHDRYFLDRVCNEIIELENGQIYRYKGNYSYYLENKAERETLEQTNISKARNLMKTELEWIRRQPKARGTKSKARVDSFHDLKKRAMRRIDDRQVELEINMERLGSKIVELHKISKEWEDGYKIVDNFSYNFQRSERVGIIGKNGTGKSTFLKLLTGNLELDGGKVIVGETVKFGYYKQEGLKIKEGQKVIEVIREFGDYIPLAKGRQLSAAQLLEKFLFDRKQQYDFVEKLSGGEKRRLYLCTVLIQNPNFLILDEPTNDLDILTLNILEDFLQEYPGVLVVVSHDRYFMDKIVDHVFVFKGEGAIQDFPGNYTEYRIYQHQEAQRLKESEKEKEKSSTKKDSAPGADKPSGSKLSYNEKREYGKLEVDIERLETKKKNINKRFETEELEQSQIEELATELEQIMNAIEEKTDRWLELSMKLEE